MTRRRSWCLTFAFGLACWATAALTLIGVLS